MTPRKRRIMYVCFLAMMALRHLQAWSVDWIDRGIYTTTTGHQKNGTSSSMVCIWRSCWQLYDQALLVSIRNTFRQIRKKIPDWLLLKKWPEWQYIHYFDCLRNELPAAQIVTSHITMLLESWTRYTYVPLVGTKQVTLFEPPVERPQNPNPAVLLSGGATCPT